MRALGATSHSLYQEDSRPRFQQNLIVNYYYGDVEVARLVVQVYNLDGRCTPREASHDYFCLLCGTR